MKKIEQMRLMVQQWKESGLTQQAYCEKIGVKRTMFANWAARIKVKTETGFIALAPPAEAALGTIEIIYPNGVRLKASSALVHVLSELIRSY